MNVAPELWAHSQRDQMDFTCLEGDSPVMWQEQSLECQIDLGVNSSWTIYCSWDLWQAFELFELPCPHL